MEKTRYDLNKELAQMLKGGVIMDVTTPEQAKIAQEAGACAVMALERIPADIRACRRCIADERPTNDQGDSGGRIHSCHGKMPHRSFRGGTDLGGNRNRLY